MVIGGFFSCRQLVGDFSGSVSIGGFGSFIREEGGVCVGETDGDLGGADAGEIDGVFEGEGGVDGSYSSTVIGPMLGESSMTSGSSMLVTVAFKMSKWTIFDFFLDKVVSVIASLNASEICYRACFFTFWSRGWKL